MGGGWNSTDEFPTAVLALLGQGYIRFLMFKKFPIMRFFNLIEINLF